MHALKKTVYFFQWLLWVKKDINVKYFVDALNLLFSRWDYQKVDLCAYPGQAVYWEDDLCVKLGATYDHQLVWAVGDRYMEIA